jgi:hypothetical protein
MIFPTTNKQSSYGKRPHIKKGYYPAQLISIKKWKDKEGNLKETKFGHSLILLFAVYKTNGETDTPVVPIKYKPQEGSEEVPLILAAFPDYEWKDNNGEGYRTAFTPKSQITKIFTSLGWKFEEGKINVEDFIGKWVELNINDYEKKDANGISIMSVINKNGIEKYNGGPIPNDIELVKPPQEVKKNITSPEQKVTKEELESRINLIRKRHKEGDVTQEGLNMAEEQFKRDMESLEKND